MKKELERIYEVYCKENLEGLKGEDKFIDMLEIFVDFRLEVSGGEESSMGRIGCESIEGFLNEIFLFDSMISDWNGSYRGDYSYEDFERLVELLDESNLSKELKNEIIEGFKKEYSLEDEEED